MTATSQTLSDDGNLTVPAEVYVRAKQAYPVRRRRRQCSYQDFESGYIAMWIESNAASNGNGHSNGHSPNGHAED